MTTLFSLNIFSLKNDELTRNSVVVNSKSEFESFVEFL